MPKIEINKVAEILLKNKIEPALLRRIIEEIQHVAQPDPGEETKDMQQMVDEGVRRAYLDPGNKLRASILADPAGERKNTGDNTPACINVELVKGGKVGITVAAKGGGSGDWT